MSIIFTILKVLGIILAVVLGLVLFLLLITLFLPICYKMQGRLEEEQNEISGKCSWLFSLIQVRFLAKGKDIRVWLSVCGWKKTLYPSPEEEDTKDMTIPLDKTGHEEEPTIQAAEIAPVKEEKDEDEVLTIETEELPQEKISNENTKKQKAPKKKNPKKKKEKSLQKYLPWNMIKSWIEKINASVLSIKEKIGVIKKELSDETNKNALSFIIRELKKLIHYFGPRRGKANLRYSTGDPALTGQLTGLLSLCPFCYKKGVHIVPDFASDRLYIRGRFRISGHIQIYHLLGTAFRAYRNRDIRKIIQKFK